MARAQHADAETPAKTVGTDGKPSTSTALMDAGLRCFARSGYVGARLTDIVAEAGVTTGALYGYFDSKADFFDALFVQYGDSLQRSLDECRSLEQQLAAWIRLSRDYKGVIRASAEILLRRPDHTAARNRLREACAGLLSWYLREPLTQRDARLVSRILVDILDQYALMEASEAIQPRNPEAIARTLHSMVTHGLYLP
jgi:AcrR family transcriptional regulator